ncbi:MULTISPECIES: hypothetical protein [Brevibacillus]|uniref:hypothetical protein n=1 Tax=Brevibacillus TaxID=55080 RepID=UPI000D10D58F|nr:MULTISPECIES: hypothetical protein [Brevibacillus]MED1948276.1 hypothetical protein [Brevibacillus formosus]MED1997993.1 hypothetical protein [Brevibacillus formosus]MED2080534.1 hypothetical protein [Brevibacillus formosus]PSK13726.1 hypothetical protein C7R94_22050 [Brevibacillus sp. NRRL NRS-603]
MSNLDIFNIVAGGISIISFLVSLYAAKTVYTIKKQINKTNSDNTVQTTNGVNSPIYSSKGDMNINR